MPPLEPRPAASPTPVRGGTMRAAISRGRRALGVEDVTLPEPGPGEVRIRVSACGVCSTDLHLFSSGLLPIGMTPGHEIAGTVDCAGAGASALAPGEPVVVEPLRSCGRCRECRAGRDSICTEVRLLGFHESGGMAEYPPGGTVCVLGVFLGSVALDPTPLLLKEATLAWSNCDARSWLGSPRADFEDAVALVDGQRELLAQLVTHSVPLGEVERGFEIASDKKAGAVKVSVRPNPIHHA